MEILSQRDAHWANMKLGMSGVTIGGYGCTITCLSMIAGVTPDVMNDTLIRVGGFVAPKDNPAQRNLVNWEMVHIAFPFLSFVNRGYGNNEYEIVTSTKQNGFCLVEVDFDNNIRTDGRHWVLYIGDGLLIDPWTGTMDPVSKYPMVTGYSIFTRIMEDDMTDDQFNKIYSAMTMANKMFRIQNSIKFIKPSTDNAECGIVKTKRYVPITGDEMVSAGLTFNDLGK